jgi:NADP-dependent 3-hydroxy acid dehydrogenase YdfG
MKKDCYLITGGGSGTGKAVSESLKKQGVETIIWGTNEEKLKSVVQSGGASSYRVVDVSEYEQVAEGFKELSEEYNLLGVVHAAGIWTGGDLVNLDPQEIKKLVDIITLGSTWVCREAVKTFSENGGKIVLIAAASGKSGFEDSALNTLAKRSMDGLQEALSREIKNLKIKLTTIYPDSISDNEEAIKKGDSMSYQDVTEAILFALNAPSSMQVREMIITSLNTTR